MSGRGIQMTGMVGQDPELKFLESGMAVANFSIANTPRTKKGDEWVDGTTVWMKVAAWGRLGENVAESVTKGTKVIVIGQLQQSDYEKDGVKKHTYSIRADEVGLALSSATGSTKRNQPRSTTPQAMSAWSEEQPVPMPARDPQFAQGGELSAPF